MKDHSPPSLFSLQIQLGNKSQAAGGTAGQDVLPKHGSACQRAEELSMTHSVEKASCHSSVSQSIFLLSCTWFKPTICLFSWLSPPPKESLLTQQKLRSSESMRGSFLREVSFLHLSQKEVWAGSSNVSDSFKTWSQACPVLLIQKCTNFWKVWF